MAEEFIELGINVPPNARGQFTTKCPKCQHLRQHHPNATPLSVNLDSGLFKCHHCGDAGSLRTGWNSDRKNGKHSDYSNIRTSLQKIRHETRNKIYEKPKNVKIVPLPQAAIDWFEKRKITQDILARYNITFGDFWFPQLKESKPAIQFPYYEGKEIVNVKGRRETPERIFAQTKNGKPIPYGYNDVVGQKIFIICEGETDKLSWAVAGIAECCSPPTGAINPEDERIEGKLQFLEFIDKTIKEADRIYIATDSDPPGRRLEQELVHRIGKWKCWLIRFPDNCKDANDVLKTHGSDALKKCYDEATPYPIEGLLNFTDYVEQISELYLNGSPKGESTGWRGLDQYYTVKQGQFTVVTGEPGAGKSSFVDAMAINLAKIHGWKFCVFTPENMPIEEYFKTLAEKFINKPFDKGVTPRITPQELEGAIRWLSEYFIPIGIEEEEIGVDKILELARVAIYRHGVKGVILDPWNEVEHDFNGLSETQYTSKILSRIRKFARYNGIHFWLVAHPAKMYRNKAGQYPEVTLYDIAGSANFKNKADNGIVIKIGEGHIVVDVQKVRRRTIGKRGQCLLEYNPVTGNYRDTSQLSEPIYDRKNGYEKVEEPQWLTLDGKPAESPF